MSSLHQRIFLQDKKKAKGASVDGDSMLKDALEQTDEAEIRKQNKEFEKQEAQDEVKQIMDRTRGDLDANDRKKIEGIDTNLLQADQRRWIADQLHENDDVTQVENIIEQQIRDNDGVPPNSKSFWKLLSKVSFKKLLDRLGKRDHQDKLEALLSWLGNPPKDFQGIARKYVLAHFTEGNIKKISSDKLRNQATLTKEAALKRQTLDIFIQNHRDRADAILDEEQTVEMLQEESRRRALQQSRVDGEEEVTEQDELARMDADAQAAFELFARIGIDNSKAKAEFTKQRALAKEQHEREGQVDAKYRIKAMEAIFQEIHVGVQKKLRETDAKNAQQAAHLLEEFSDQLLDFGNYVEKQIARHSDSAAEREHADFFTKQLQAKLRQIKLYCQWVQDADHEGWSQTDLLNKLTTADELDPQSKAVIRAMIEHAADMQNEVPSMKAEYTEARENFHRQIEPYLDASDQEQIRFCLQNAEKIANDIGLQGRDHIPNEIGVDVVREALRTGDLGTADQYTIVREWGEKYGIEAQDAARIASAFAPVAAVISTRREDIVRHALEKYAHRHPEEELNIDELVEFATSDRHDNTMWDRFVGAKNSMENLLVEEALRDLSDTVVWIFNNSLDYSGPNREDVMQKAQELRETMNDFFQEAEDGLSKIEQTVERLENFRQQIKAAETAGADEANSNLKGLITDLQKVGETDFSDVAQRAVFADLGHLSTFFDSKEALASQLTAAQAGEKVNYLAQKTEAFAAQLEAAGVEKICQQSYDKSVADVSQLGAYIQNIDVGPSLEAQRKKKLQQFANWVGGKALPEGQNIFSFMESLENLGKKGSPVLELMDDAAFDKKHGVGTKAATELKWDGFHIVVRQSDWDKKDADLEMSLRHEGWHAIDDSVGNALSQKLHKALKQIPDYEAWKQQLLANPEYSYLEKEKDIAKELLAFLMSGEDDELLEQLRYGLNNVLPQSFWKEVEEAKTHFAENGTKRRLFGETWKRAVAGKRDPMVSIADSTDTGLGEEEDTGPNRFFQFTFNHRADRLRKKLALIEKSGANGADQIVANTEGRLQQMADMVAQGVTGKEWTDMIIHNLDELDKLVGQATKLVSEADQGRGNIINDFRKNTVMLSAADVIELFSHGKEFIERRHQRRKKGRVGKVGKPLLENIYGDLANEFDNKAEEAEVEEVQEYEKGMKNKDGWQIMQRVGQTNNQDELKACFNSLAEKGELDIYDRRCWRALERVQSQVRFYEEDSDDPTVLRSKWQRACGIVWDSRYFNETDSKNLNADKSAQDAFTKEVDGNQTVMDAMIKKMIEQKHNGEKVNPQRYKKYVFRAIEVGKSDPKTVFWYLLQGHHFGLANQDWFNEINADMINNYPPIEWFYLNKPTSDQIRAIAETFAPKPEEESGWGPPKGYNDWFFTHIMTDKFVRQRIKKASSQAGDKWDHDWAQEMTVMIEGSDLDSLIVKHHGVPKMNPTAMANMTVGHVTMMMNLIKDGHELPPGEQKEFLTQLLSTIGKYNALTTGKIKWHRDEIYQFNPKELKRPPRLMTTLYSEEKQEMSTQQMIDIGNTVLKSLDSDLFSFLDEEIPLSEDEERTKELVAKIEGKYKSAFSAGRPANMKELLDKLPSIIDAVVEQDPDALQRVFTEGERIYRRDHKDDFPQNHIGYNSNWRDDYKKTIGGGYSDEHGMWAAID